MRKTTGMTKTALAAFVFSLTLTACGGTNNASGGDSGTTGSSSSTKVYCQIVAQKIHTIVAGVQGGTLTNQELITKLAHAQQAAHDDSTVIGAQYSAAEESLATHLGQWKVAISNGEDATPAIQAVSADADALPKCA